MGAGVDDLDNRPLEADNQPIHVDRIPGTSGLMRLWRRIVDMLLLVFRPGLTILVVGLFAVILIILAISGNRADQAATQPGVQPTAAAASDGEPNPDPAFEQTATPEPATQIPVGTYSGGFTADVGPVGRIYQEDPTEVARTEVANAVTIAIADDGTVTGTLEWHGQQESANQLCTTVRWSRTTGTLAGTAGEAGAIDGVAELSDEHWSQSTCDGVAADPIAGQDGPDPFPFSATVSGDVLTGEVTGIYTFTARRVAE